MERGKNSSIRINKGTGELNHEAKLSENDVLKIINLIEKTSMSFQEIADLFDVDKSTINNIVQNKKWKHLVNKNLSQYRIIKRNKLGRFYSINPFIKEDTGV